MKIMHHIDSRFDSIIEVERRISSTNQQIPDHELDYLLASNDNEDCFVPLEEIQMHCDKIFEIDKETLEMLIDDLNENVSLNDQNHLYKDFETSCLYEMEAPTKLLSENIFRIGASLATLSELDKYGEVLVEEEAATLLNLALENLDIAAVLIRLSLEEAVPKSSKTLGMEGFMDLDDVHATVCHPPVVELIQNHESPETVSLEMGENTISHILSSGTTEDIREFKLGEVANPKGRLKKICHYSFEEKAILNALWEKCKYPSPKDYDCLAEKTNISKDRIRRFFKNRRQRRRNNKKFSDNVSKPYYSRELNYV